MTDQPTPPETVHACPPDGAGLTPCCGRPPFELPRSDRMTTTQSDVTCSTDHSDIERLAVAAAGFSTAMQAYIAALVPVLAQLGRTLAIALAAARQGTREDVVLSDADEVQDAMREAAERRGRRS